MAGTRWQCTVCLTGFDEGPHVCDLPASVQRLATDLKKLGTELETARDIIKDAAALLSEYMPGRWAGWHDKASRVVKK